MFFEIAIAIIFVLFVIGIYGNIHESSRQKEFYNKLDIAHNFTPTQKIIGTDKVTGIAIDEKRKKIALINHSLFSDIRLRIIAYQDILSSEIFVDGETITKTVRTNQLGGAIIGGLALGGVGAIIGGLSGKTKSVEEVHRVDLRIIVNDTQNPLHDINFMMFKNKKNSLEFSSAMEKARYWHGLLAVVIKNADSEGGGQGKKDDANSQYFLADELSKLGELRDKGILSENEFSIQKAKLLS